MTTGRRGALALATVGMVAALASGCATSASSRPTPAETAPYDTTAPQRVDALLERLAGYGYGGAVAIGDSRGLLHAAGYGLRDRERELPFEAGTAIDIGSLTKVFTATLVLRLWDEGVLSVGDSLGSYLPDVPADKAGITIHQLLTHTSGLLRSAVRLGVETGTTRDAFVAAVLASDLLYPPGTRFEYSDTGYDLLAALVEAVTGEAYSDALADRVLDPAGLTATGYIGTVDPAGVADSYASPLGSPWYDRREGPSKAAWYNRGSGGLVSTVADLQRLSRGLRGGELLDPTTVSRMMTAHVEVGDGLGYGYGWYVRGTPPRSVFHGGDIAGYKAHLEVDLATGRTVAAFDNVLGWEKVTDQYIVAAWEGRGPALPPAITDEDGGRRLAGTYRATDGTTLVLWDEAGAIGAEARGQAAADLLFGVTDDHLRARTRDAEAVLRALADADTAFLADRVRDRDRIAGMPQRLLSIWGRLAQLRGPVERVDVSGSYPGQDGTVISFVDVFHESGPDPLRLVWRGDRLVAVGGSEGLRAPTAALTVVDGLQAARFEPSTGQTTTLRLSGDRLTLSAGGASLGFARDEADPIPAPTRSLTRALVPVFLRRGPDAGMAELAALREARPDAYDFDEAEFNRLGYRLLYANAAASAIAVFRHAADTHPESWNAFDSLGEAYLAAGDVAAAREAYAESLRLNPDNETARQMLTETGGGGK